MPEERPFDAIVIGSGASGTAAANALLDSHKKVLVVEKRKKPGGCMHVFDKEGGGYSATFDSGFHIMTNVANTWIVNRLYGPAVHFDWPAGYPREVVYMNGQRFDIPNTHEGFLAWMRALVGNDTIADRFERHMEVSLANHQSIYSRSAWDMLPQNERDRIESYEAEFGGLMTELGPMNTLDYLHTLTPSREKQAALIASITACLGFPPEWMPAAMGIVAIAQFSNGFTFPIEGSRVATERLIQRLEARGGELVRGNAVEQILIDEHSHRVSGVRLKNGTEVRAHDVIASVGLDQIRPLMGGVAIPNQPEPPNPMFASGSFFITYVIFDAPARELGIDPLFLVFPDAGLEGMSSMITGVVSPLGLLLGTLPFFVAEMTLKTNAFDEATYPAPPAAIQIFTPLYHYGFDTWTNSSSQSRPGTYYAFKQMLQDAQLGQFFAQFPDLQSHVVFKESATPLTVRDYVEKTNGAMMGYFGLPTKPTYYTGIPGLWFTGCDVAPGVDGAAAVGEMAAYCATGNRKKMVEFLNKVQ